MPCDLELREQIKAITPPTDFALSYSEILELLDDPNVDKVLDVCLSKVRDAVIEAALIRTRGNQRAAAAKLGIGRSSLRDYLRNREQVIRRWSRT